MKVMKVLPKGQIVIPKQVREEAGIIIGKKVIVEKLNGSVLIMPEPKEPLKLMQGLLKSTAKDSSVETVRKLRREWERRSE